MGKDRRQLSREQIREYLQKSDEKGELDTSQVEDKDLKRLAKDRKKGKSGRKKSQRAKDLGRTIATRVTKVTGNFTDTIAGTIRAEFEDKEFKNRIKAFGIGLGVAAAMIAALTLLPLTFIEKPLHDAKMKVRPFEVPETPTFMHLDLDDKSISAVGRFPWKRTRWAEMISGAKEAGIDQVVFDVEFFQPQDVDVELEEGSTKKSEIFGGQEVKAKVIDHDATLATAIKEAGNVYLPMHFNKDGNELRKPSRSIEWNEQLIEKVFAAIDQHGEKDTLETLTREEIADALTANGISQESATKAAQNELTSLVALYLFRKVHRWYEANPDQLWPHMQEWLANWRKALVARGEDVLKGVGQSLESANMWTSTAYEQLHRCYSWNRFIKGENFDDTPWFLPTDIIEGFDGKEYDHWQSADKKREDQLPFYVDFEVRPSLFQFLAYSQGVGFVSIDPDSDGTIREVPLVALYRNTASGEDRLAIQLAFFVLLRETNTDFSSIKIKLGSHVSFRADPVLMATHRAADDQGDLSRDSDGLREYRYAVDQRGFLTINWAGNPDKDYGEIFGHIPVANLVDVGAKRSKVLKNNPYEAIDAKWQSYLDAIPLGEEAVSIQDLLLHQRLYAAEKGPIPAYDAMGFALKRFAGKFNDAAGALNSKERADFLTALREEIIKAWLADDAWWTLDEKGRRAKAKEELPTLADAVKNHFLLKHPHLVDNAEVAPLFDVGQSIWKSRLSGALGPYGDPLAEELVEDKGPIKALSSESGEIQVKVRRAALMLSLALSAQEAVDTVAAGLSGGREELATISPALFAADSPFGLIYTKRLAFLDAVMAFRDAKATKDMTLDALAKAGFNREACASQLEPVLATRSAPTPENLAAYENLKATFEEARDKVREVIVDRIGLVGAAATGLGDIRPIPTHEEFPGPGVHSNLFNTMVHHQELTDAPALSLILVVVFAVAVCFVAARMNVVWGLVLFNVLTLTYLALDVYIQSANRAFLDTTRNYGALFAPFLSIQVFRYAVEYRAKNKIKSQFAKFLSPQAVEQIQENPDALKLGGDEAELCVYFSDIAGFTPISESMTAPRLIDWLNEYMTRMCEPIRASDGYVDKFIGDAVMAFWGKPNPLTDYSARACKTAVQVKALLKEWNRESIERGIPEAGTRIGLATGPMVAGNMGTDWKINFTAIGDTVNLGARLEGANKQYGTQIMINDLCYRQAKDIILAHHLDVIAVKGKKKGVPVYHLISTLDIAEPDHVKGARIYDEAFENYQNEQWKIALEGFHESKQFLPKPYLVDYGPYDIMIERCESLVNANTEERMKILGLKSPDDEWDGVFKLTSK
ncbi:MAG: CHASE2 domain-containing protein [Planctomycetes bacterium]|nr:CHASE2 domain-containing protein [Planctomycetota bacterium]